MNEKITKGPKDLLTEQEIAELENMTEGQLTDYLADEALNSPF